MTINLSNTTTTVRSALLARSGWVALVAGVVFLVQPLSVALLPVNLEEIHDPVELTEYWWAGTVQSVEFFIIGIAVLVMVTALRQVWPVSTLREVAGAAGIVAAAGLLLEAALSAASYSSWLMRDTATAVCTAGVSEPARQPEFSTDVAAHGGRPNGGNAATAARNLGG